MRDINHGPLTIQFSGDEDKVFVCVGDTCWLEIKEKDNGLSVVAHHRAWAGNGRLVCEITEHGTIEEEE